jgi:hypothetical protein
MPTTLDDYKKSNNDKLIGYAHYVNVKLSLS